MEHGEQDIRILARLLQLSSLLVGECNTVTEAWYIVLEFNTRALHCTTNTL